MTTPTAIEAVAKAICARMNNGYCDNVGVTHGCKIGRGWHNESDCRMTAEAMGLTKENDIATAAIAAYKAAIREPTWEMQIAGRSAIDDAGDFDFSTDDAAKIFRAMLDKAEG